MAELKNIVQKKTLKGIIRLSKLFSFLILLLSALLFTNDVFCQSQTFNYTGSNQTFTVPAGVTSVTVEAWGGGGGGGERYNQYRKQRSGGGGGGGGYRSYTYTGLNSGNTFTITIGNGGAASNSGNGGGSSGNNGNNTTIARSGQANLVALGGTGGGDASYYNQGAGGAGAGAGSGPTGSTGVTGTGGSDGNGNGSGGNGGKGATANGGAGAAGAANGSNNDAGTAGIPGGGGGGANNDDGSSPSNGANGRVIFTWTPCPPPGLPAVITPVKYCKNETGTALTATGSNLLWYTSATGGSGSSTAPVPVTTSVGSANYYVSQTVGCEGPRANINVIVNALPVASVSNQTNISCYGSADGKITVLASGGTSPYTFSIDNGSSYFPATGTNLRQFIGLLANTAYHIKVKDNNGCISND